MPVHLKQKSALPTLDLPALSREDPQTAEVGYCLNASEFGGVDTDGDPYRLTLREFQLAAPRFLRQNPSLRVPIAKLAQAFQTAAGLSGPESVQQLGLNDGIDVKSAAFIRPDGSSLVVYENFDEPFSRGQLMQSSGPPQALSKPEPLDFGLDAPLVGAPSAVRIADRDYLYFMTASSAETPPKLYRSPLEAGGFGAPEPLGTIDGMDSLLSWPRFHSTSDGRVAVAYHDGFARSLMAISQDGLHFEDAQQVGPQGAAMADISSFQGGGFAYCFQTLSATVPFSSWVRISANGKTWSAPIRVTDASPNVHDTSMLKRKDGGIDLYYCYPAGESGFSVMRRAIDRRGRMGPEQRVTKESVGDTMKPTVSRLQDGRVLLTMATGTERSKEGFPTRQRLDVLVLEEDAPTF